MMSRCSDPTFSSPTPSIALDVNWLRECAPGFPIGVRSVRAWTHAELSRALTGTTGIEWLRGLFAESCSARWTEMAEAVGARPSQMDDLALHFRGLSVSEEDALWRVSATEELLGAVRTWVREVGSEGGAIEREIAERGAAFWRSTEGEWLRAAARTAAERSGVVERMAALLTRNDLARTLVRLHEQESQEWESAGGEDVSRRVSTRQAWRPAPRVLAGVSGEARSGRSGQAGEDLAGPLPCGRGSVTEGRHLRSLAVAAR